MVRPGKVSLAEICSAFVFSWLVSATNSHTTDIPTEEMKEDSGSDYGNEWDDMTVDQRVQMDSALAHVRSTLGPQETSGFSDKEIKDSLWYYYFDAEKTISWLLEERTKAEKKKNEDPTLQSDEPPVLLTALQRLSLSRQSSAKSNAASKTAIPDVPSPLGQSNIPARREASSHIEEVLQPPQKLSKLAMLAKSRAAGTSGALPTSPAASSATSSPASSPAGKSLSKLQLKMQAARLAKGPSNTSQVVDATPISPPQPNGKPHPLDPSPAHQPIFVPPTNPLFTPRAVSSPSSVKPALQSDASPFASILVSPQTPSLLKIERAVLPRSAGGSFSSNLFMASMHLSGEGGTLEDAQMELKIAFEGPSPDDIVLEKRKGTKLGAMIAAGPAVASVVSSKRA
ncbi:ef tu gtp-binding domain protein [Phaffia rhodozyma]|uniref:Ef tu gtp-binding domain protein n=1 Tax=Phaffia rhodozyma TaxID=264483 RepID=A0A0F7SHU9_PHARH|nr:ef tu gtp-binding domain protein [Phaffia rhodozyma]